MERLLRVELVKHKSLTVPIYDILVNIENPALFTILKALLFVHFTQHPLQ